ncbi:MAG: succinyldiaminopimelate transaminase [Gammaproteobacteria bacterium]|nr:succinyldiaminopimelate transaminase [Gammaproteobacteria bacterium]
MNPYLDRLQSYPFERLNALKAGITPNAAYLPVALSIGEPKHAPPGFVLDVLSDRARLAIDLSAYPATKGIFELREAIAGWLWQRFSVRVDPERQVLPVAGTREALFSFGQAVLSNRSDSLVILPNPFYQIYEGAALLRGAEPYFVAAARDTNYQSDFRAIGKDVWARCELLYLCSPGNPTGTNLDTETLGWLIEQAERFDFVIAADECYSEIYLKENEPPVGLLQAACEIGNTDFHRCVVFHSLSKRSNLPGLRSGFVAGDADILERYYQYRTYEGCALPNHVQAASIAAWSDEAHVVENRAVYREKFLAVAPILERVFDVRLPEGGFYFWLPTPEDDQSFTQRLFAERNITVLPGSFLARTVNGENPGQNHVRVAWVAPLEDCVTAAQTIVDWLTS